MAKEIRKTIRRVRQRGEIVRPLSRAVRCQCLECVGWNSPEVARCTCTSCHLWPYRFGTVRKATEVADEG